MKSIKIYADQTELEGQALNQFYETMKQDFVVKGALMPDAHVGYTLPIGGVVATKNMIVPSYIGFDVNCSVLSQLTTFKVDDIKKNPNGIFQEIYNNVPVGFKHNKKSPETKLTTDKLSTLGKEVFEFKKGFKALGTLGGGKLIASRPRV